MTASPINPIASRAYYSDTITGFLKRSDAEVKGLIADGSGDDRKEQKGAWQDQLSVLRAVLPQLTPKGKVYFEFVVPRIGRRIDVLLAYPEALIVLEFKSGEAHVKASDLRQVWDYALDLKNFHRTSHHRLIAPILVPTELDSEWTVVPFELSSVDHSDGVLKPVATSTSKLTEVIKAALAFDGYSTTHQHAEQWEAGSYAPTPTIVDAARALYDRHGVGAITQNDAKEMLTITTAAVESIVADAQRQRFKAVVFVTGVPGAGKTLVGLNVATRHADSADRREERARKAETARPKIESVFLSGNGPLVDVLRESLALDKRIRDREAGRKTTLDAARREVRTFIQNVHEFRDAYFTDPRPPSDRVVVFDEAQRAWNSRQTAKFMHKKHGKRSDGIDLVWTDSEPEFLISCMDRHPDWAVIVCLVGGGQEINTGEAGISEWIDAVQRRFPEWRMFLSPHLHDSEYAAGGALERAASHAHVRHDKRLHLAVSMRSFRAKGVSAFVKHMLDLDLGQAEAELRGVQTTEYPIFLTRSLKDAKKWLRQRARGNERFGLLASSSALRLRPLAIDTRPKLRPAHWFLKDRDDVRSSYYLEDVATEFHVQGLELDYAAVVWDGDLRITDGHWDHNEFKGNRWLRVKQPARRMYLKNAYRVLLTRARQGMVLVVPSGSKRDKTRKPEFYDGTWEYLRSLGVPELPHQAFD